MEGTPAEQKLARRLFPYLLRKCVEREIAAQKGIAEELEGGLIKPEPQISIAEHPKPAWSEEKVLEELRNRLEVIDEAIHILEGFAEKPPGWMRDYPPPA